MADNAGQDRISNAESVVRSYWERIWLERDLDALQDLVSDPTVRHGPDGTETLTRQQYRQRLAGAFEAIRASDISVHALTADGDTVWIRLTMRGVSLASASPTPVAWMGQYRVSGGRIVEIWSLHQTGIDWEA
ncbi:MAG: nuclear transport factor 2 family protein [Acidimicrobiaceae bacterium]|nr:nuclear transport factor 2 family protein [Acidimicrobiaceae bacterium]